VRFKERVLPVVFLLANAVSAFGQNGTDYFRDKAYRDSRARQWREGFTKLDTQIPTLSLAEERWLKTEIDDTILQAGGKYTPRSLSAMDSREYQIRVAKPHIQKIIRTLDQLLGSTARDAKQEAALWTQLAVLFLEKGFWQSVDNLVRRKIVQEKLNDLDGLYYENHVLWGQQILDGVVLPYLRPQP
jgi:hypothetical protein